MSTGCLVVMYHYVRDSATTPFPRVRALPPEVFERQLDWLQKEHCVIALDDFEAALDGRVKLPANAALLTFDDGFTDHYEVVLPILRQRGLRGVFFLAQQPYEGAPRVLGVHKVHFLLAHLGAESLAAAVRHERELAVVGADGSRESVFGVDRWEHADERSIKALLNYEMPHEEAAHVLDALFARYLGPEDAFARDLYLRQSMVAEMAAAGMSFGYHTCSHRMLSRLSDDEQERELREGVGWISQLTGQSSVSFCYPWGGRNTYTRRTVQILQTAGYSAAFTSERRRVDLTCDARLELPRVDTRDLPPYAPAGAAVQVLP